MKFSKVLIQLIFLLSVHQIASSYTDDSISSSPVRGKPNQKTVFIDFGESGMGIYHLNTYLGEYQKRSQSMLSFK
jgi:hypothetical protein